MSARSELADRMRLAYLAAGKPTLAALSARVGYSTGHLSKVLRGESLPSWVMVADLAQALGTVSAWTVGSEWHPLWVAARAGEDEPAPDAGECGICGAYVTSKAFHADWHTRRGEYE